MKTIKSKIVAVLSAVLLVMGAFFVVKAMENNENPEKIKQTPLRWFKITGTHAPGNPVPTTEAQYIQTSVTPPTDLEECNGEKNQCISGFNTSQTNPSGGASYALNGTQTPVMTSSLKD